MKFQIFKTQCNTTEKIFIISLTILLGILTFKTFSYSTLDILTILKYLLIVILFLVLAFLAYYDFKKLEVHNTVSFVLMITLVILNASLFLIYGSDIEIELLNNWRYIPYQNIIGTLTLGSIFQLLVLITKEKGLGQGDVRIAIITGMLIGFNNLLYWGYITVFTALIYGFFLSYKKKRFKNLKIPLVPFMVVGIVFIILLSL